MLSKVREKAKKPPSIRNCTARSAPDSGLAEIMALAIGVLRTPTLGVAGELGQKLI
jgi:hypothetical protein